MTGCGSFSLDFFSYAACCPSFAFCVSGCGRQDDFAYGVDSVVYPTIVGKAGQIPEKKYAGVTKSFTNYSVFDAFFDSLQAIILLKIYLWHVYARE